MNSSIRHCHLETSDGAFFWQYCIEMRASMTALEKVGSNPIAATIEERSYRVQRSATTYTRACRKTAYFSSFYITTLKDQHLVGLFF